MHIMKIIEHDFQGLDVAPGSNAVTRDIGMIAPIVVWTACI